MRFVIPLASCLIFASCNISITGNLYPVEGQFAEASPVPVIPMKVHNVERNSGTVELTLPSGELCQGNWSVTAPRVRGSAIHSSTGSISSGLNNDFVQMHGTSFIDIAAPGVNKGQAMLVGNAGTILECAFLVGSGTASGYGTAKDNKGNIYKVIF